MMANNINHGLSRAEITSIGNILRAYSDVIERVGIFGSRATGKYKEYSDIDLVLYGNLSMQAIKRLDTLFDESNIALKIDIKGYQWIDYQPLKRHIDTVSKTLFTQHQLRAPTR